MNRQAMIAFLGAALLSTGCEAVTSLLDQGGVADDVAIPAAGFSALYNGYLGQCASCHAPGAPGYTGNIEKTLDFSTEATARSTLRSGSASGLEGNVQDCNGVAFVGETYDTSLIAAVLDQAVRSSIALGAGGACNGDTITDMTVKAGEPPAGFLGDLKGWIDGGALL
jgi:mono/diheme cytochrome c family protein